MIHTYLVLSYEITNTSSSHGEINLPTTQNGQTKGNKVSNVFSRKVVQRIVTSLQLGVHRRDRNVNKGGEKGRRKEKKKKNANLPRIETRSLRWKAKGGMAGRPTSSKRSKNILTQIRASTMTTRGYDRCKFTAGTCDFQQQ